MGIFDIFKKKKETGFSYSCAKCGVQWDPGKMEMLYGGSAKIIGVISPGTRSYAGRCSSCGKLYCGRCASITGVTVNCPDCKTPLKAALH